MRKLAALLRGSDRASPRRSPTCAAGFFVRQFAASLAALALLPTYPIAAQAAGVTASDTLPAKPIKGAGGTTELYGYSANTVGNVTTTNDSTLGFTVINLPGLGGQGQDPLPGFGVLGDGTVISVKNNAGVVTPYGPPVAGLRNIPKPELPTNIVSQVGTSDTAFFDGRGIFNFETNTLSAKASGQGMGKAAGGAFDPVPVAPGSYAYNQVINASIQLDNAADTSGVLYFAVDSRQTDPETFYANGEPLNETLWYLSIAATGPLTSLSDLLDPSKLSVTFQITDPALLDVVDPSNVPYTNAEIAAAVRDAFTVAGDTATLTDFDLFPVDPTLDPQCDAAGQPLCGSATYNVDSNIEYGVGVNAALTTTVPEPTTAGLLATALTSLVFLRRRWRVT